MDHPLTSNADIVLLLAQQLTHRHLWRCDLPSLAKLAGTSPLASQTLKPTLSLLKTRELKRRNDVKRCHQLLRDLPLPLLNAHWTDGIFARSRVYVSYNGRLVVRETSATVPHNRAHSLKVSIRCWDQTHNKGVIMLFSQAHPQFHMSLLPRRLQTFAFNNTRELLYVLRLYTMLGSSLWFMHFKEAHPQHRGHRADRDLHPAAAGPPEADLPVLVLQPP